MKRIISKVMLVAAAAMASFACQKPEAIAPEEVTVDGLNFSAEKPEFADASKTEWTGSEIHWSKGDAIRVAYTCNGVWQNAKGTATAGEQDGEKTAKLYASTSLAEASVTAKFKVPGDFKGEASGVYEFYAIYPSGAAVEKADFPYAPSVTVDIPTEQTPLSTSFDSAADLMAAKSVETFKGLPTESISLLWTRIVAHGHLTIKNLQVEDGEKLQTITLTADKDADMVGEHYLYLEDTYNVEKANGNNVSNSLTVKADNLTIAEGGNVTFWTCFLPCTWKSLDVVVETDKATYTRSIDLTGNEKTFKQNARNTLGINMASAERVVRASSALPFERDFSNTEYNQNAITELDGFTIENSVYNAKGAIRLAKQDAGGSVTTLPLDLSQNFHVKVVASGWDDDELTLTVTAGDQSNNLTLVTSGTVNNGPEECAEYIINFQPVSNSASVTFTTEAKKRCYIQKIQILEGHAELIPVLSATNPGEMSAEGGEGSFTYILSNPKDGKTVSATENSDWIEILAVNQEAKTVSYNVAENTSEEAREGTITLSYEGAQSVDVVIAQEGKASENAPVQKSVTYTVTSTSAVSKSGDAPDGAAASYSSTYGTKYQLTSGNSMTFTLSGYDGCTIKGVTLSMKSNSSSGSGTLAITAGNKTVVSIADSKFNTSNWNGSWSTSYVDVKPTVTSTVVGNGEKIIVKISATANSLYCQSITIDYLTASAGGETPDPDEPETPVEPTLTPRNLAFSAATATATMGQAFTTPTLSGVTTGVTYSSSNTAVATVNNSGVVTILAAGTTTITASAPATNEYEAGTASYTLTVSAAPSSGTKKTFTIKSDDIVSNSGYQAYTNTVDGRSWVITCGGNNKSVGVNSSNRSKCNLTSANYKKYAVSPITTSSTASAFASTTQLRNVSKISYAKLSGGSNHASTKIYILYSPDGTTFSQISLTSGTQGAAINTSSGGAFEFAECSGYFAVVFAATNNSGNWRLDDVNLTFTYTE